MRPIFFPRLTGIVLVGLALAGCAAPAGPADPTPPASDPAPATMSLTSAGHPLVLTIDGTEAGFLPSPMVLPKPATGSNSGKQWDLGSLIGYPTAMTAGNTYTSLTVWTSNSKSLFDPNLKASDITEVDLAITHAVDKTHYAKWTAAVTNPGAGFSWITDGSKISLHLETTGTPGVSSSGVTATTPALVFEVKDLPLGP